MSPKCNSTSFLFPPRRPPHLIHPDLHRTISQLVPYFPPSPPSHSTLSLVSPPPLLFSHPYRNSVSIPSSCTPSHKLSLKRSQWLPGRGKRMAETDREKMGERRRISPTGVQSGGFRRKGKEWRSGRIRIGAALAHGRACWELESCPSSSGSKLSYV